MHPLLPTAMRRRAPDTLYRDLCGTACRAGERGRKVSVCQCCAREGIIRPGVGRPRERRCADHADDPPCRPCTGCRMDTGASTAAAFPDAAGSPNQLCEEHARAAGTWRPCHA
jgi:hypothetical protein